VTANDDERSIRISGDLLATTARAINAALASTFQDARWEVSTEVAIETDAVDIAIYPYRRAPNGGTDFLLTGNIWRDDEANAVVERLTYALTLANIAYSIEVETGRGCEPRKLSNKFFKFVINARQAERDAAASSNVEPSLDAGPIIIGDRLRSGSGDEVRVGWLRADPSIRCLITLTGKHAESHATLRHSLTLDVDGIAPLELLGSAEGIGYEDALVERIAGAGVAPPFSVVELRHLGTRLATIVARAHSTGAWLGGIRPELVFVSEQGPLLAPRGPRFIASSPLARGMRSYSVPFMSPEELLYARGGQPSDVFSLCATLFFLGTDRHPFGDTRDVSALVARLAMGTPDAWPEGGALAELLVLGMRSVASERPTAAELAELLSRIA
jgi:hypothetical protein